jgi:hypothetical protein
MDNINDNGGPAFPWQLNCPAGSLNPRSGQIVPSGTNHVEVFPGITARDYFAAKAMQGMMARDTYDSGQASPGERAALAYIEADAMLAARSK